MKIIDTSGSYYRDIIFLLAISPLVIFIAGLTTIFVLLCIGNPIFYRQTRAGRDGEAFSVLKFRSMTNEVDGDGNLLPDEQRLDSAGRLIRRFRVDEVPSFLHIFSGKLALVGPRPLPLKMLLEHPLGERRLRGKPGFTGLAQVSGNTLLALDEKFAIDVYYLENRSALMDIVVLARTVQTVVWGEKRDEDCIRLAMRALS